tara:strand:+ start:1464 stop:1742 length:279 start_codon:yes stop_codon:yes gene_type:complete
MNNYHTHLGQIIVNLGGMQITRDQLDAVKIAHKKDTDQSAVDYLIQVAESSFSKEIESAEYIAYVEDYDGSGPEYVSPDEHLSTAYCDAIRK